MDTEGEKEENMWRRVYVHTHVSTREKTLFQTITILEMLLKKCCLGKGVAVGEAWIMLLFHFEIVMIMGCNKLELRKLTTC